MYMYMHKGQLISWVLPFVVAVVTVGIVAAAASGAWPPGPPASASKLVVSSAAPAAVEGAWPPAVSAAPQTAYVQEGLVVLTWSGVVSMYE